jgi:membrane fusion protein (multidrug efflux system)
MDDGLKAKNGNKFKKFLFLVVLIAIAILGFHQYNKYSKTKNTPQPQSTAQTQPPAIDLPVMRVKSAEYIPTISLPGRIKSYQIAEIRPQVTGIIKDIKFTEGTFVKENDKLYEIDKTTYLANYKKAESNLKTAEQNEKRYKILYQQNASSKQEYANYLNALEMAKSDLELAKANLTYTDVLAPISGFIGQSNFTKGALVNAGQAQAMAVISTLSPIYADISIPRNDLPKIKGLKNAKVDIFVDNIKETGVLQFSEVIVNQTTDSVILRATFRNELQTLMPGMYVNAKVNLSPQKAILVPQKSTFRAPDNNLYVFAVNEENTIVQKPLTVKEDLGNQWVVTGGLEDGETIILEGFQKVRPGAKINPVYNTQEGSK